jgi:hypothetical protein
MPKISLKFFACTQVTRNASSTVPAPVVQLQLNLKSKSQKKKKKEKLPLEIWRFELPSVLQICDYSNH